MKKDSGLLLPGLILLIAGVLRFHHLGDISFSNDELSALTRARFDSFSELVEKGIRVDGHPALVQTMIWYLVHHVNDDVFTIRFFFALSGLISVILIYLLGKRWFGKAAGLLSATALATLQYPLLYSQTARPYSIGLMFSLALALAWTKMLFDEKRKAWVSVAYVLSAAGCIYTNYFSFLLAGIIGISGLFFTRKDNYMNYIICNLIALLLFIPSIGIFMQQIGYGGLGSWLPPPDAGFLRRFLFYSANESFLVLFTIAGIAITGSIVYFRQNKWNKFQTLALTWFLLSFAIGFAYSKWIGPVMQFSTLLFSFPFLLLFVFSFVSENTFSKSAVATSTLVVLSTGVFSTVVEKKYFLTNHFGVFKELAEKITEWDTKYKTENVNKLISLSNPAYLQYYFKRLNHDPSVNIYTDDERNEFAALTALLDTTSANYFAYGWTNAMHFNETVSLIREKFPVVEERNTYFNSEITLFGKGVRNNTDRLVSSTGFEFDNWGFETERRTDSTAHSGTFSENMAGEEYSVSYKVQSETLKAGSNDLLRADVWFKSNDRPKDAALVISFTKNGEVVEYNSIFLRNFFTKPNKWTHVILFSSIPESNCELSVYVWNPKLEKFFIDDLSLVIGN